MFSRSFVNGPNRCKWTPGNGRGILWPAGTTLCGRFFGGVTRRAFPSTLQIQSPCRWRSCAPFPTPPTGPGSCPTFFAAIAAADRSEEHTSALQSPCHIVCRLLLEHKRIKEADARNRRGGGGHDGKVEFLLSD